MDCSPPVSSVHGIFKAGTLEWVAISSSRASSWPRDWICISCVSCIWPVDSLPLSHIRSPVPGQHTTYTHPNISRVKYQPSRGSPCAACCNYSNELILNLLWKSKRVPEKHLFLPYWLCQSLVWITINCGKFWKRCEYQTTWPASWETYMQVRKQQLELDMEKTDWFQIGKGARQGCILSPCLFNLYAEYIMRNAGLEEAQAGIKISGININNLR